MTSKSVTVIDLGIGNLFSIKSALEYCGFQANVTFDLKMIEDSSLLVLPGDGAFNYAMSQVKKRGLFEVLKNINYSKKKLLGICVGMQILFDYGLEFEKTEGLGLIPGNVVPLPSSSIDGTKLTIPRIGWNPLVFSSHSSSWKGTLLENNNQLDEVYFIHSFMANPLNNSNRLADYIYGKYRISAVVKKQGIMGCQFHPEKSGKIGLKMLKKFLNMDL
jgi:glutamine amidotransferase|tara:strand:- start:123 stop:776 length:654 start_codon:yes stop_codon:yes gene_type:complete